MKFSNIARPIDFSLFISLIWLLSVKEILIFNEELLILGCFVTFICSCFFSVKQTIVIELNTKVSHFKEQFDSYANIAQLAQKQKKKELQKNNDLQLEIRKLPTFFFEKIQNIPIFYARFLNNLFAVYVSDLYGRLLNSFLKQNLTSQVLHLNDVIVYNLTKKFNKQKKRSLIETF